MSDIADKSELSTALLAEQVMQRCDQLAAISAQAGEIHRFYLTPEHKAANQLVAEWMHQAGMTTREDEAGNVVGHFASANPNAKTLLIGSHLDTIPNAGAYDGILGVLLAIAAVAQIHSAGVQLPFHIDVIGFGDEEGIRFGATLLGSFAAAGCWNPEWWQLTDSDGISMAEAFRQFGLNPEQIADAAYRKEQLLAYLEVHIEQGPVLEQEQLALGIVTAIAGARRFQIQFDGFAGHAGTVPMALRQDALVTASLAIAKIELIAVEFDIVATVGQISCQPGAVNVIPGQVQFSLDIRAVDDAIRDAAVDRIEQELEQLCLSRNITWQWQQIHHAPAVACAQWLMDQQAQTLSSLAMPPVKLMSGAGHDAMAFADITDIAMYFVRCKGGISHHPDESITQSDAAAALEALSQTIVTLQP